MTPAVVSLVQGKIIGVLVHLRKITLLGLLIAKTSLNTEKSPASLWAMLYLAIKITKWMNTVYVVCQPQTQNPCMFHRLSCACMFDRSYIHRSDSKQCLSFIDCLHVSSINLSLLMSSITKKEPKLSQQKWEGFEYSQMYLCHIHMNHLHLLQQTGFNSVLSWACIIRPGNENDMSVNENRVWTMKKVLDSFNPDMSPSDQSRQQMHSDTSGFSKQWKSLDDDHYFPS